MGRDVMKLRRRNLRIATNTLLVIISAYLISNLLNLFLSLFEYLYPGTQVPSDSSQDNLQVCCNSSGLMPTELDPTAPQC